MARGCQNFEWREFVIHQNKQIHLYIYFDSSSFTVPMNDVFCTQQLEFVLPTKSRTGLNVIYKLDSTKLYIFTFHHEISLYPEF